MQKPYAIDIDDVLCRLSHILNPALNKISGKSLRLDQWHEYNLCTLYGIERQAFYDCIIKNELLSVVDPIEGAQEALSAIKRGGSKLVLITSRGYHPKAERVTLEWLERHALPFDDLIIVPEGQSKAEAARDRYPSGFTAMVDDYVVNLDLMKEAGLVANTVVIDHPWNRHRIDYRLNANRFTNLLDYAKSVQQRRVFSDQAGGVCEAV